MWAVCTACRSRSRSLVHEPQECRLPGRSSRYNRAAQGVIPRFGEPTEQRERERGTSGAVGPAVVVDTLLAVLWVALLDGLRFPTPRRRRRRASQPAPLTGGLLPRPVRPTQRARPSRGTPAPSWSTWGRDFECCFEVRLPRAPPRDAECPSADQPRPDPRNARSSFLETVEGYIGLLEAAGFRVEDVDDRTEAVLGPGLRSRWVRPTCTGASTLRARQLPGSSPVGEVARGARSQQSPNDLPGLTARSGPQSVRRRGADGSIRARTDARSRKEQVTSRRGESREDPPDVGGPEPHVRRPPGSALVETDASATDSGP